MTSPKPVEATSFQANADTAGAAQNPLPPAIRTSTGPGTEFTQTQAPATATKQKRRGRAKGFVPGSTNNHDDTDCPACEQTGAGRGTCAKHTQKTRGCK
jgi:hypothetical protein